jgi:1-acyl-sn-glycerol-3-phosphate acyltransferase
MCRYLDGFIIAKAEVANYPIINKGAEITGVIWVDRNNHESRADTRSKLVEMIESGYNIIVYPEGTVGKDKEPLPFKKGSFHEAFNNNIDVVPVAIEYKSEKDLWKLQKFIPQYLYQFSKWKTEVKISFGNPIKYNSPEDLHAKAYTWVCIETSKMQENWSQAFL